MGQPNDVIASRECFDCKERVQIKLNKNYMAYYYCICGGHHRFNRGISIELDNKFNRMNGAPAHEPANDNSPRPIRPTGNGDAAETGTEKAAATKAQVATESEDTAAAKQRQSEPATRIELDSGTVAENDNAEPVADTGTDDDGGWTGLL